jgi:farnesyl diphosphate synthase
MAGGQALDLSHVGQTLDLAALAHMHRLKTGALIEASLMMGATCGDCSETQIGHLQTMGQYLGLAFQVRDDVLDATQSSAQLGKTAGKDAAHHKPTYVQLLGIEAAQAHAHDLGARAIKALDAAQLDPLLSSYLRDLAHQAVFRLS